MLQTLSGKIPYHEVKSGAGVLVAIAQGIHPRRPNDGIMTDNYWELKQLCWGEVSERPSAEEGHRDVTGFHGAMAGSECRESSLIVEAFTIAGHRMLVKLWRPYVPYIWSPNFFNYLSVISHDFMSSSEQLYTLFNKSSI
ncbi:hypothetical protein FIBSPDRAFT_263096 [Athelia psychrophila]|uniref:Uncharacterized protein n=1 Tax=Athelia psychrophila TaxID=1759441 RepID=A0A165XEB6_9AGAM|nr:hypothetical protein FIBSPDRAFT_263096 [Fibularhizoctonia sp. CBS 109695]